VVLPDVTYPDDSDPERFHKRVRLEIVRRMPEGASEPQA
jgi:hypothetical protein